MDFDMLKSGLLCEARELKTNWNFLLFIGYLREMLETRGKVKNRVLGILQEIFSEQDIENLINNYQWNGDDDGVHHLTNLSSRNSFRDNEL